jgi:4-oxalomesaconate tautomerase
MNKGIPCMWMRGGTSKGAYFASSDLPADEDARDALLLHLMGSPDPRQIDGMGGGDPLTSKVAIVKPSDRADADVDYLFLQVFVDQAIISDAQNCGNIVAGVAPFAIERGMVPDQGDETLVRIYMENTGQIAQARVQTPDGHVSYAGGAMIDGVPNPAAPIPIAFSDTAGSSCGALFPTGNPRDVIDGTPVTMIDNGMPSVLIAAQDLGISGYETPAELEENATLRARLEQLRLQAGPLMNLGDVREKSVPKMTIVAPPKSGGAISTRTFIPHRCHKTIGVLGAVSVATAIVTPECVGHDIAHILMGDAKSLDIEHPSGATTVIATLDHHQVTRAEVLRTARKIMDGMVF